MMLAYLVFFGYYSCLRHWSLGTYYYDLGIMHQVLFNTSRGHILQMTDPNTAQQISRFSIHFDPLMLVFVPFYWLFPYAEVLLIGQTVFLASGAIPVYLLTKEIFKKVKQIPLQIVAIIFVFLYLDFYPMQKINLFDFHAVALVIPLLLWAMYFIERGKYSYSLPFLAISLLGKENVALIICMIGFYLYVIKKQRLLGASISILSTIMFIFIVGFLIPSQRQNLHFAESYYTRDVLVNIQRFFSMDSLSYLYKLFRPMGFLPILSPLYLLLALPEWMINLLSKSVNMRDLQYHYTALLTPFIIVASIYSFKKIYLYILSRWKNINKNYTFWALCVVLLIFNSCTTISSGVLMQSSYMDRARTAMIKNLAQRLRDPSIPISASGHLAPFFSGRTHFYNFLFDFSFESMNRTEEDIRQSVNRYENANYIIIQKNEIENQIPLVNYYYAHLLSNPKFKLILDRNEVLVFHKIGTPEVSLIGI